MSIINQFIITSSKHSLDEFEEYRFKERFIYFHKSTRKQIRFSTNGDVEMFLVGNYFKTDEAAPAFDDIQSINDIIQALYYWSGRFILFANGFIYNDCSALAHIYYSQHHSFITNSILLASQLFKLVKNEGLENEFWSNKETMDWVPPPSTQFQFVYLLLSFRSINLDFEIEQIENIPDKVDIKSLSKVEIIEKINAHSKVLVEEITRDGRKFVLALTGGHDSRLLFTMFLKFANYFEVLLFDHPNIPISDLFAFKYLTSKYKIKSKFIRRNLFYNWRFKNKLIEFDRNCVRTCKEIDRYFYAYGQLKADSESLMLRSNVISEIFRSKNYNKFKNFIQNEDEMIYELKKKYSFGPEKEEALKFWYRMRFTQSRTSFTTDWRIAFWLDQRSTGWVGYIDNAAEISDYIYINPFNAPCFYHLFEKLSMESTSKRDFIEEIIEHNNIELLKTPFNIDNSYFHGNGRKGKFLKYIIRYIT